MATNNKSTGIKTNDHVPRGITPGGHERAHVPRAPVPQQPSPAVTPSSGNQQKPK